MASVIAAKSSLRGNGSADKGSTPVSAIVGADRNYVAPDGGYVSGERGSVGK